MLARVETTSAIGNNPSFISKTCWSACIHRDAGRAFVVVRSPAGATVSHACNLAALQVLVSDISPSRCAVLVVDLDNALLLDVLLDDSRSPLPPALTATVMVPEGKGGLVPQLGQGTSHLGAALEGPNDGLQPRPHFLVVSHKQQGGVEERHVTLITVHKAPSVYQSSPQRRTFHAIATVARISAQVVAGRGKTRAVAALQLDDRHVGLAVAIGSTVHTLCLECTVEEGATTGGGVKVRLELGDGGDKASMPLRVQVLKAYGGGDVRSVRWAVDASSCPVLCWTSDAPLSMLPSIPGKAVGLEELSTVTTAGSYKPAVASHRDLSLPTPVFVADGLNEVVSIVKSSSSLHGKAPRLNDSSASLSSHKREEARKESASPLSALAAAVQNSLDVSRDIASGVRSFSRSELPSILGDEREDDAGSLGEDMGIAKAAVEGDVRGLGKLPPSPTTDDDHHTSYTHHTADSMAHSRASPANTTAAAVEVVQEHISTFGSSLTEVMATWDTEKAPGVGKNVRKLEVLKPAVGSVLGQLMSISSSMDEQPPALRSLLRDKPHVALVQDLSGGERSAAAVAAPVAALSAQWMRCPGMSTGRRIDCPLACLPAPCRSASILDVLPLVDAGQVMVAVAAATSAAGKGKGAVVAQVILGSDVQPLTVTPVVAKDVVSKQAPTAADVVMAGSYTSLAAAMQLSCLGASHVDEKSNENEGGPGAGGFLFMGCKVQAWHVRRLEPIPLPQGISAYKIRSVSSSTRETGTVQGSTALPSPDMPSATLAPGTPQRARAIAAPLRPLGNSDRKQKKDPGTPSRESAAFSLPDTKAEPKSPSHALQDMVPPGAVGRSDGVGVNGGSLAHSLLGGGSRPVLLPRTQQPQVSSTWRIASVQPVYELLGPLNAGGASPHVVANSVTNLLPLPAPVPSPPSPELPLLAVRPPSSEFAPSPSRNLGPQFSVSGTPRLTQGQGQAGVQGSRLSGTASLLHQHHPRELVVSSAQGGKADISALTEEGISTPHLRPRSPTERKVAAVTSTTTAPIVQGSFSPSMQLPAVINKSTPPEKKQVSVDRPVTVPRAAQPSTGSTLTASSAATVRVQARLEGAMSPPQLAAVGATELMAAPQARVPLSSTGTRAVAADGACSIQPVSPLAQGQPMAMAMSRTESSQRVQDRVRIGHALFRETHSAYDSPVHHSPPLHAVVTQESVQGGEAMAHVAQERLTGQALADVPSTALRSASSMQFFGLKAEAAAAQALAQAQASKALNLAFRALTVSASEGEVRAAHKGIDLARFALEIAAGKDV